MSTKTPPKATRKPSSNVIQLKSMFGAKKVANAVGTRDDEREPLPEEDDDKIVAVWLDESEIDDNPFQPRTSYKREKMDELRDSMISLGQIHLALVRWNEELGRYQFAVGHRRRIIIRSGVNVHPKKKPEFAGKIRVEIRRLTDLQMRLYAIEENDAREEMNPIDRARAYVGVYEECKKEGISLTWQELAESLDFSYRQMHRVVELLDLPPRMINALENGKINAAHGAALVSLNEDGYKHLQGAVYSTMLSMGLSGSASAKLAEKLKVRFLSKDDQLSLTAVSEEWEAQARAEAQKIIDEVAENRRKGKTKLELIPGGQQTGADAKDEQQPAGQQPPVGQGSGAQPPKPPEPSPAPPTTGAGTPPAPTPPPSGGGQQIGLFGGGASVSASASAGITVNHNKSLLQELLERGVSETEAGTDLELEAPVLSQQAPDVHRLKQALTGEPGDIIEFRNSPEFLAACNYCAALASTLHQIERVAEERAA